MLDYDMHNNLKNSLGGCNEYYYTSFKLSERADSKYVHSVVRFYTTDSTLY